MYVPCLDINAAEVMKSSYVACSMLNLSKSYFFSTSIIS